MAFIFVDWDYYPSAASASTDAKKGMCKKYVEQEAFPVLR
jgi:hypothetical protein